MAKVSGNKVVGVEIDGGKIVPLYNMLQRYRSLSKDADKTTVVFQADKDFPFKILNQVMRTSRDGGLSQLPLRHSEEVSVAKGAQDHDLQAANVVAGAVGGPVRCCRAPGLRRSRRIAPSPAQVSRPRGSSDQPRGAARPSAAPAIPAATTTAEAQAPGTRRRRSAGARG